MTIGTRTKVRSVLYLVIATSLMVFVYFSLTTSTHNMSATDSPVTLGLSVTDFQHNQIPAHWRLRKWSYNAWNGDARWIDDNGQKAVKLHSNNALTFLQKHVDIDLKEFPLVSWKWKVDNNLSNIDETTLVGDDHPIRLFFVFEPDKARQSLWMKLKRRLYLDLVHGHPFGGRFTEYLWSSYLSPGDIINDPGKPWQKLMVMDSGTESLGTWISHQRNLYEDYKQMYKEEPRKLIFIGILNDTDQTGQAATSYIVDLRFAKNETVITNHTDDTRQGEQK